MNSTIGPAHAVYFGTYEAVKELAGGNVDDGHHPVAAGKLGFDFLFCSCADLSSVEWRMRDDCQRCPDESVRWYVHSPQKAEDRMF
jgi:hypothetical protein